MTTPPTTPLLVLIGPSGSGKSSLVRHLAGRELLRVHPTWTTRPRRPDEVHGSLEHRFVDDATFAAMTRAGAFLDTVELFGLPYRYGLRPIVRGDDGRIETVMLRAPLVPLFRRIVHEPAVVVAIEAEPVRLAQRLRSRGTGAEDVRNRLADNAREVALGRAVADVVLTNDATLDDLATAVLERLRPAAVAA